MHEYHLIQTILKTISEKTAGMSGIKKISSIRLTLGQLKMVSKESFSEIFKELSKGTMCEGAKLDIEEVPGDVLVVEHIEAEFE
ncbi:MAG: hydrogenase maturation nickel metallochaperone HypA [Candidatus Omnitrophota bacterium]